MIEFSGPGLFLVAVVFPVVAISVVIIILMAILGHVPKLSKQKFTWSSVGRVWLAVMITLFVGGMIFLSVW